MLSKSIATAFAIFAVLSVAIVGVAMTEDADAEFTAINVTYDVGGTTYAIQETVKSYEDETGAKVNYIDLTPTSKVAIPTGYEFKGWYLDGDSNRTAIKSITITDGTAQKVHAILIPTSTLLPMTVTYVVEGQADITVTIPAGTAFPIKLLSDDQFSAYGISIPESKVFAGWYLLDPITGEGAIITEITVDIADDMTVYATLIDNVQLTVTIDGKASKAWAGTVLDAPEAPAIDGKVFKCWMIGDKVAEFPMTVLDDVTITSVYEDAPVPEPVPVPAEKKDNSGMVAVLCVIGIVVVIGAGLFVWTLKKDKKA